jgi:glycosyltransferase involved in cell wall biosynthesis
LAKAITRLLTDRLLADETGKGGRKMALERFPPGRMYTDTEDLYMDLLSRRNR